MCEGQLHLLKGGDAGHPDVIVVNECHDVRTNRANLWVQPRPAALGLDHSWDKSDVRLRRERVKIRKAGMFLV